MVPHVCLSSFPDVFLWVAGLEDLGAAVSQPPAPKIDLFLMFPVSRLNFTCCGHSGFSSQAGTHSITWWDICSQLSMAHEARGPEQCADGGITGVRVRLGHLRAGVQSPDLLMVTVAASSFCGALDVYARVFTSEHNIAYHLNNDFSSAKYMAVLYVMSMW